MRQHSAIDAQIAMKATRAASAIIAEPNLNNSNGESPNVVHRTLDKLKLIKPSSWKNDMDTATQEALLLTRESNGLAYYITTQLLNDIRNEFVPKAPEPDWSTPLHIATEDTIHCGHKMAKLLELS